MTKAQPYPIQRVNIIAEMAAEFKFISARIVIRVGRVNPERVLVKRRRALAQADPSSDNQKIQL
jgi:hypothetical protein